MENHMDDTQIAIPLGVPDVRVLQTLIDEQGAIIITIESTKGGTRCRRCGKWITELCNQEDWITTRYLSAFGHPAILRYRPQRYQCQDCAGYLTTQRLEWQDGTVLMVS
jgi:transposase